MELPFIKIRKIGPLNILFLILFFLGFGKAMTPLEINLEIKREKNFLKVYTICYNPNSEAFSFKISLKIIKKGLTGISNVIQNKKITLLPKEKIKPMLGLIKIDPEDFYTIELKVWDEKGNLILEKTINSENLV